MRSWKLSRIVAAALLLAGTAACDQSSPTEPPRVTPSANQAPRITPGAVSPALGIDDVTTFTVRVEVRDPDGDPVALRAHGCSLGQGNDVLLQNGAATVSFQGSRLCGSTITFIATDPGNLTAIVPVPFQHTSLRGWYRLVLGEGFYDDPHFYVDLTQSGTVVTGTIRDLRGHSGVVDPQEPGTIDAAGSFRIRFKIQSEGDLLVTGRVTSADFSLFQDTVVATGTITDGPYVGRAFKIWREAQY